MHRRLALVLWIVVSALPLVAQQQVAEEVIQIVKAQWAAEAKKNIAEAMKNVADDYTEFNGEYSTRVEGKAQAMRLAEANASGSGSFAASEMANPKVQVYGEVAILSYNFVGVEKDKEGRVQPIRAKSTRVYVRQGGQWRLVHANFAPDPLPR